MNQEVKAYAKQGGTVPANLVIRVSATMVGDKPVTSHPTTSTVHRKGAHEHGHECLAYRTDHARGVVSDDEHKRVMALPAQERKAQGWDFGHCGDCRACWSPEVTNVSYGLH